MRPLFYLVKQELQSARRSRYVMIAFFLSPLLVWGMQAGVQLLIVGLVTDTANGGTIYVTNGDSNSSSVRFSENFTLPFDFEDKKAGENVTEIKLADYFVAALKEESRVNTSLLYQYRINDTLSYETIDSMKDEGRVDVWIEIPAGFSSVYNTMNYTSITLHYLPGGLIGPSLVQAGVAGVLRQEPFQIVDVQKSYWLTTRAIELGAPGESEFSMGAGLAGFLSIMIAVMAPAPFVSTSFAGEREKKTMEALLALPLSRQRILLGKIMAGMMLVGIFAAMNLVGMAVFGFVMTMNSDMVGDPEYTSMMGFEMNFNIIPAITIAMFLAAFIAIGVGIAIASLTKDVRTSESLYNFGMMIPTVLIGMVGMFMGVPEEMGGLALLLYVIPWSHALAIFTKILRPGYYDVKALFGSLWMDIAFHLAALVVTITIILYVASKIFEREGIVS